MRKLIFLFIVMLTAAQLIFAADLKNCSPVTIKSDQKNIILPGPVVAKTSLIYFIKNKTDKSLWIDHPTAKPSASAGWSSYLRPGNWSAFLVNRKNFSFSCAVIQPGKVDYLNCSQSIFVCIPKQFEMKAVRQGTYWLVEDKPWENLSKELTKRGFTDK